MNVMHLEHMKQFINRIHNFTMGEIDLSNHGHEVYGVVFMIVLTFNGCLFDTYEHSDRL
jgi:hypothetical protein